MDFFKQLLSEQDDIASRPSQVVIKYKSFYRDKDVVDKRDNICIDLYGKMLHVNDVVWIDQQAKASGPTTNHYNTKYKIRNLDKTHYYKIIRMNIPDATVLVIHINWNYRSFKTIKILKEELHILGKKTNNISFKLPFSYMKTNSGYTGYNINDI